MGVLSIFQIWMECVFINVVGECWWRWLFIYQKPQQSRRVSRPSYFPKVLSFANKISRSYKSSGSVDTLRIMTAAKTEEYQSIKSESTGKMCSSIHQRGFQGFMFLLLVFGNTRCLSMFTVHTIFIWTILA